MTLFYAYKGCSTCTKARKWLDEQGITYEERAIRETPPSLKELRRGLHEAADGQVRRLCNTSGQAYRASGLKDRINAMSDDALLKELAADGNLIKRPFLVSDDGCLVGFKPDTWASFFGR